MGTKKKNTKKQPSSSSSSSPSPSTSMSALSKNAKCTSQKSKPKSKSKLNQVETPTIKATSHLPANILHLANETLHQIISHYSTDTKTLLKLSLVCKTFRRISSTFLWRHVKLSPWFKDLDENGDPEEDHSKRSQGRLNTSMKNGHVVLPNVRILTLNFHPSSWCHMGGTTTSLRLPNLETLYIKLQDFQHPGHFHIQHDHTSRRRNPADQSCRLLRDVYPKTIIVNQVNMKRVDLGGIKGIPISVWKNCEELVLISSQYQWVKPNGQSQFKFPPTLNTADLKITWISDPSNLESHIGKVSTNPSEPYRATCLCSLLVNHPDIKMTIVDPDHVEGSPNSLFTRAESKFKGALTVHAQSSDWSDEMIEQRLNTIRYRSMYSWLADKGNWKDKISDQDAKNWKLMVEPWGW